MEFVLVTVALLALALAFVVLPLVRRSRSASSQQPDSPQQPDSSQQPDSLQKRSAVNIEVYRERLADLERERAEGRLEEGQYRQLTTELQRRLLEESDQLQSASAGGSLPKWVIAVIGLAVPLMALGLYQQIGAKADWQITNTLQQISDKAAKGNPVEEDIQTLVKQLNQRLQQKPESVNYLMLLGNTQMRLNNYPAATDAFQRLEALMPGDALVLASYAQALYLSSNRQLTDKVLSLSQRALAINPAQTTVLSMLGIAHFEQGDFRSALDYWQRLLPAIPPNSPNRSMIMAGIAQARARLGESAPDAGAIAGVGADASTTASLTVEVSLADSLQAEPGASVFVYARALNGPPMPLAVQRLRVADLPTRVSLDDSMAMMPAIKLSAFPQVEVIARISKQGIANRGSGDLEGVISPVVVAEAQAPLSLQINRRVP